MERIFKTLMGTVGAIVGVILFLLLVKGISMIPISLWDFVKNYWPGIIAGVVISFLGMGISEMFECKKARKKRK